jgi:hypothetical protein
MSQTRTLSALLRTGSHIHRIGEQLPIAVDNLGGRPPDGWGSMAVHSPAFASIRRDADMIEVMPR